ncbi:Pentapeptide repeat-containing protein [Desulfonauticus submarinus]|uniref:Pentapeptide repeat-containing protein n=1 Tax=Desulfonauticus submarinus TaxID=206665 RepID=A0A1G9ZVR0_9BACT|nr:pentapeptide repeat-containing protein [Desulfonauticus submarinus]SDN25235.1 Pentapeptide repeat-containing protein [Desulfonauticus submarinus]
MINKNIDNTFFLLERTLSRGKDNWWVGTFLAGYHIDEDKFILGEEIWSLVADFCQKAPLDNGMPKLKGEYLCYGRFSSFLKDKEKVYIKVDNKEKKLEGDLFPSEIDFFKNRDKLGTYDSNYIKKYWPAYPPDMQLEIFNLAPLDQRISGFWTGSEEIVIKNGHPTKREIKFKLPGKELECYFLLKNNEIKKININLDTLIFFPEKFLVVLVYRVVYKLKYKLEIEDEVDVIYFNEIQENNKKIKEELLCLKKAEDVFNKNIVEKQIDFSKIEPEVKSDLNSNLKKISSDEVEKILKNDKEFYNIYLVGIDFSNKILKGVRFEKCVLDDCLFLNSSLQDISFKNSIASKLTFKDSKLNNINIDNSIFEYSFFKIDLNNFFISNSVFKNLNLKLSNIENGFIEKIRLNNINITDSVIKDIEFIESSFEDVEFNKNKLFYINVEESIFSNVNLNQCKGEKNILIQNKFNNLQLNDSIITDCDFSNSFFQKCIFINSNLNGSCLEGCTIRDLKCNDIILDASYGDDKTILKDVVVLKSSIQEVSFISSEFINCHFENCNINNSVFSKSKFKNNIFLKNCMKEIRFDLCKFIDSKIKICDCMRSDFYNCFLDNVSFELNNMFESNLFNLNHNKFFIKKCNLGRTVYEKN